MSMKYLIIYREMIKEENKVSDENLKMASDLKRLLSKKKFSISFSRRKSI